METIIKTDMPAGNGLMQPPGQDVPLNVEGMGGPGSLPAGCPKLATALAAARDRCKAASKDAENKHHGYKYASADEVIATASEALAGSGLALIPQSEELLVLGAGSFAYYGLHRLLLLSHSSGEFVALHVRGWPVVMERGRPLDKAYAIALTTSLAYKLRDLLQMPRGTGDDVAAQDDTRTPIPQTDEGPPWREAAASAPEEPSTLEQSDRIADLVGRLGLDWARVGPRLQAAYGVDRTRLLTAAQAADVINKLEARLTP